MDEQKENCIGMLLNIHYYASAKSAHYRKYATVSWVSAHGHLNITHNFGPIRLYRSCYSGPLKFGTWALTQEWALAQDTTVVVHQYVIASPCTTTIVVW